jgi:hypothetical protein
VVPTAREPKKGQTLVERDAKPVAPKVANFRSWFPVENCSVKVTVKVTVQMSVGAE